MHAGRETPRVALLVLASLLALAGCTAAGEQRADSPAPNTPPATTEPAPESDAETEERTTEESEEADEPLLAYSRCMREQGLDYPDPARLPGGGFGFSSEALDGLDPAALDRGFAACGSLLDPIQGEPPTPEEEAAWLDAVVEYARCMRAHGIDDLPDPRVDHDGGGHEPGSIAIEPWHKGDPAFERATAICDEEVARWMPGGETPE